MTGYGQARKSRGLPYLAELAEVGNSSVGGGEIAAHLLLRREPSGIFITNNQMAIGAVRSSICKVSAGRNRWAL